MKIAFNPSTVAALITPPNNKDITFDLRGRNIFARGVKFCGTDTWRDIKINNVSIGSNILDLRNGSNTTLTNTNGVVTINSTWRPVVDNLTSDSTTSSLSANQGRVLKALIDGKSNSGHTHDDRYLKLTGGTMTGNIILSPNTKIIKPLASTSNYDSVVRWSVDGETKKYGREVGLHNDGGSDSTGSIAIVPYKTDTAPWSGTVGLFIAKNVLKLDGKPIAFKSDIPSSLKNPYSLTTFGVVYDGSAAKVVSPSNFISLLEEVTGVVTDGTMFITSWASNNGFADTNAVNVPYKRKAIRLWDYIKTKTDSLYYTKSEVNNFLSKKLDISDFNWTNLPGKLAGNEFNIVNAGFNNRVWFNYLPINDRSKTATITGYSFGNGAQGYASVLASGFVKTGSSSSYVLLGDGGHQTISSLSVNHASFTDYIRKNKLPTPINNTVKAYKDSLVKFFENYPNGIGANVSVSTSIISQWLNDTATYFDSSEYSVIKISGSYNGTTYGQFLLSSYNLSQVGIVGRNNNEWSKIKWLAYEDQIPTDNNLLANGAGYITSAGSCAYATRAGNADTVDGYHATAFNDKPWGYIPVINLNGYMDIGKHLEFHYDNTTGSDYSTILRCTGNYANIVNLPSESGTLALTKNVLTFSNDIADYLDASFNNSDFSKKAASKYIQCYDSAGGWWNWMAGKFMKAGSSNSYVLLGGGDHKAESSLNVANADTVDGEHASSFVRAGNYESADLNKLDTYSFIKSVNSNNKDTSPKGNIGWYNVILAVHRNGNGDGPGYIGQIALGMTTNTDDMFFRGSRTDSWKTVIHSGNIGSQTVASATKLQTPRSIWGQSFDGTNNINGTFYFTNGDATMKIYDVASTNSLYGNERVAIQTSFDGLDPLTSSYPSTYPDRSALLLLPRGGNIGIGTTSPSYKLHVAGDIYTTTGFKKNGSSDSYVLLGGGGHKLESSLRVAYASNADTVDGYHVDDILPYGLENLCIGAVASGGQTILNSDGSITTSGNNSDTYFHVRSTENLIAGLIYTVGFYVTGVPSGNTAIWSFGFAGQGNNNLVINIKSNGWCWGTGTIPKDIVAGKNIIFDDVERGFYSSINISKFVIVKGKQKAYYTPPISKMSVNHATSSGNADTVDGQHFSYLNSSNSPTYLWATNSDGSSFLAARASISVNYANSANNATNATKLTSSAGSATLPIYFSDGKPVACTASSVFSNLSNSGNNLSITVAGQNRTLTVGYATSAGSTTKVIVNLNTTNDTNYPLVWSNLNNSNTVTENQLYKSWSDLYYNPKNKRLTVGGSIYAAHFYESSDKTLKKNIKSILSSTNIPKIREFDWKDTGEHSYGFIALELEELGYGCLVNEADGKKTVNYTATLALTVAKLLNLINIQNKKISNLTKELKALKYGRKKNS